MILWPILTPFCFGSCRTFHVMLLGFNTEVSSEPSFIFPSLPNLFSIWILLFESTAYSCFLPSGSLPLCSLFQTFLTTWEFFQNIWPALWRDFNLGQTDNLSYKLCGFQKHWKWCFTTLAQAQSIADRVLTATSTTQPRCFRDKVWQRQLTYFHFENTLTHLKIATLVWDATWKESKRQNKHTKLCHTRQTICRSCPIWYTLADSSVPGSQAKASWSTFYLTMFSQTGSSACEA